ncbi:MAG: Fe-S cluster assembly protein SufD [Bacteroidota bacterium]
MASTPTISQDKNTVAFIAPLTHTSPSLGESVRQQAKASLAEMSLPTRKVEEWKYTPLRTVKKRVYQNYASHNAIDITPFLIEGIDVDFLVFVNGQYQAELSSIRLNGDTVYISDLGSLSAAGKVAFEANFGSVANVDSDIFAALNSAHAEQGVMIHIPRGQVAKAPIHILHITDANGDALGMQHRNLVVIGEQAEAKIIETTHTLGSGHTFRNAMTEIIIGDNAGGEYIKIQRESDQAFQVDRTEVKQGRDSRFSIFTFTFSGELMRNNLRMRLMGENIESHLMGLYLLDGNQHVDNATMVDHALPHGMSNELYKGIMDEQSTGVFSGRIHVYEDAQKTNAYQTNRNIVLTETANVSTKPQLEIYADDVKCSHGATTGRLDESSMFYLMARGIKEVDARKMLVHAFAMEVADNISIEPVKEHIAQLIESRY